MIIKPLSFIADEVVTKKLGSCTTVVATGVDMSEWVWENREDILDFIGTYTIEKFLEKNA